MQSMKSVIKRINWVLVGVVLTIAQLSPVVFSQAAHASQGEDGGYGGQSTIEVRKVLTPSTDSGLFNLKINGTTFASNVGNNGTTGKQNVSNGSNAVSETAGTSTSLSSYNTYIECRSNGGSGSIVASGSPTSGTSRQLNLTVGNNADIVCVITNTRPQGTLIVQKTVINDNGGTKTASNFSYQINGGTAVAFNANGSNSQQVNVGTYTVTEPATAGYASSYNGCTNVSIAANQTKTCVITNNDQAGTLIVKKIVTNDNGGTKTASDFSFQINGGTAVAFNSSGTNSQVINAGTYSVTEPSVAGYTASYDGCANITLGNGETKTCTITNNDQPGTLIINKVVTNDNGGTKTASNFSYQINGGTAVAFNANGSNSQQVNVGTYTVTEPATAGYASSYNGCTNVSIGNGEIKTCTITNDDIAPALTLIKKVINNNGGTALSTDWMLSANGPSKMSGAGTVSSGSNFSAGTYTLGEADGPSGYQASNWQCDGGTLDGSQLALALAESATCTITNDDIAPALTLVKELVGKYNGKAAPTDWTLTATGPTTIFGDGGVKSGSTLSAGQYNLSESSETYQNWQYKASDWICTRGDDASFSGSVLKLGLGDNVTCTVKNQLKPGKIVVHKSVVNNDGGTKQAGDFSVTVGKKTKHFHESSNDSSTGKAVFLVTGGTTYSVTENQANQDNYTTTYSNNQKNNCNEERQSFNGEDADEEGDCDDEAANCNNLYVAAGETVDCYITNDDNAPHLTLQKYVINDNSGKAQSSDWTLSATPVNEGYATISGNGEDGVSQASAIAGVEYTLGESGPTGYTAGNWSCDGGSLNDNVLTLSLGENAYCSITNNDDPNPAIKVVKSGPSTAKNGEVVTYTFTVTNVGDEPLDMVTTIDNIAGNGVYQSGDVNNDQILNQTETWIYTAKYTIPADAAGKQITNTVKTCGTELQLGEVNPEVRLLKLNSVNLQATTNELKTVCASDTHTLTVEQPAPVLVNTGAGKGMGFSVAVAITMLGGALYAARPKRYGSK